MPGSDLPEPCLTFHATGLTVVVDLGVQQTRIALSGDLDFATRPTFDVAVRRALREGPPNLVVDLGRLEFLAIAGVHAIEDTDRRCRADGGDLVLVRPSRAARRLLALFGLTALVAGV